MLASLTVGNIKIQFRTNESRIKLLCCIFPLLMLIICRILHENNDFKIIFICQLFSVNSTSEGRLERGSLNEDISALPSIGHTLTRTRGWDWSDPAIPGLGLAASGVMIISDVVTTDAP